jgi:hypothetical protein
MSDISAEKLVRAHLKLRDAISKLTKEYEQARAVLEEKKDAVDAALLEMCNSIGAESIKTENGTAYMSVKPQYGSTDWDSFLAFMKEHDCLHLIQQRIAQKNMQEFLDSNPDLLPPGLSSNNKRTIVVRRATAKS